MTPWDYLTEGLSLQVRTEIISDAAEGIRARIHKVNKLLTLKGCVRKCSIFSRVGKRHGRLQEYTSPELRTEAWKWGSRATSAADSFEFSKGIIFISHQHLKTRFP